MPGEHGQHGAERVRRDLQVEGVHRLVDAGPGPAQGVGQHQRHEQAEVGTGARHRPVEPLVGVALARAVAGVGERDRAVHDGPAVQPLAQRGDDGLLDGPEERGRHRPELDAEPVGQAAALRARLDPQPDGGEERVGRELDELGGLPHTDGALDAQRRRLAEFDGQAVLGVQRRRDHLLLHLAVERHGDLAVGVAAQVDQRVLLGEPAQRGVQRAARGGPVRDDDGLQGRWGELA